MADEDDKPRGDLAAVAMLAVLALTGAIPWVSVLFGHPPAFSAELGAVVTIGALFLLASALLELREQRAQARMLSARKQARGTERSSTDFQLGRGPRTLFN